MLNHLQAREAGRRAVASEPSALTFSNVSKRVTSGWILRDINLSLKIGESLVLAGLNGAGKTSLIRLVLDFWRADTGSVELFGVSSLVASARSRVAFLPERFAPAPELTGWQILHLQCGLRSVPFDPNQAVRLLRRFDFEPTALNKPTRGYSKGMAQKLGLCAVLIANADLTILDEPFSGLDPLARQTIVECLQEFRERGQALFFTSHSLTGIEPLAGSIAVIHDGRVHYHAPTSQMLQQFETTDLERAFTNCLRQPLGSC